MKKLLYILWSKFLTFFGDIKIFKFPFWFVYDPDDYAVTGHKTIEIMSILKPGDILIRGFCNYLDSKFIPSNTGWSHGAIYIGNNKVIHAVAQGVSEIDIVDFVRCDRVAVLRPKKYSQSAVRKAKSFLKEKIQYDFGFNRGISSLYCFELCAECYPKLNISAKTIKKFFGLIKKKNVFIADSFFESKDLECVFQYNPKYDIDFVK